MQSSLLLLVFLAISVLVGCEPRAPDAEPPSDGRASPVGPESTPEELEPAATPEVGGDRDTETSAEDAAHPEKPVEGRPAAEEPIPVGPEVTPPRRIDESGPIGGLHELFESGKYTLGVCVFRLTVAETGEVGAVDFLKPKNIDPRVRSAIVEATEEWRFEPATKDGRPVAVFYYISINHCPVNPREVE